MLRLLDPNATELARELDEAVFRSTSNRYRSVAKILDALRSASEHDT